MREIRNVVEMMAASAQYSISSAGAVVHTEAKQKSNGSIERQNGEEEICATFTL